MKLLPAFVLLFLINTKGTRAQEVFHSGSHFQAIADASVAMPGGWSAFGNQAGLAGLSLPVFGGSFQNRFLVNELSSRLGFFALPIQSSVFAVSLIQVGKVPFRQEKFGISYSRRLYPQLNFGIQFNYYRQFFSENNRMSGTSGLELGFQYLLTKQLTLGAHVTNPYKTSIHTFSGKYNYSSKINFGVLYEFATSFKITSELENEFDQHFILRTGFEYAILEKFFLRTGISGKPYQLSAGIGFHLNKLVLDIASSYHQYLGNSPSASFYYQF